MWEGPLCPDRGAEAAPTFKTKSRRFHFESAAFLFGESISRLRDTGGSSSANASPARTSMLKIMSAKPH
jgi:hypothetical protein